MLKGGGNILFLQNTSISNLLLLPKSLRVGEEHKSLVIEILDSHKVFKQLFEVEEVIQPILASLEDKGLIISGRWFESGLDSKKTELKTVTAELNSYISGDKDNVVGQLLLEKFWNENNLPRGAH